MVVGNRPIRVSFAALLFVFTVSTLRVAPSSLQLINKESDLPFELVSVRNPFKTTNTIPRKPTTTIISSSSSTNQTGVSYPLLSPIVPSDIKSSSSNITNNHDIVIIRSFNKSSALEYLKSKLPVEYHSKLLPSIQAAVEPIWTCHGGRIGSSSSINQNMAKTHHSQHKLAFVHVFKTAGSTMRSFFHSYARQCRAQSYATLTTCTDANYPTLSTGRWSPCLLKDATKYGKFRTLHRHPVSSQDLQAFDILGGHYRLGLLDYLSSSSSISKNRRQKKKPTVPRPSPSIRSVIFFRNAALKYVSGKVYIKNQQIQNSKHKQKKQKRLELADVIQTIENEMNYARQHHLFHSKYSTYLFTPEQYRQSQNWSMAHQAQVMMQNLIDYNVTIGMVEDMKRSMEVLQHLMDYDHESNPLFGRYAGDTTMTSSARKNTSPLSSDSILATIQSQNFATYQQILHYVQWEQEITDFALALQELQYQTMKELYGNKNENKNNQNNKEKTFSKGVVK